MSPRQLVKRYSRCLSLRQTSQSVAISWSFSCFTRRNRMGNASASTRMGFEHGREHICRSVLTAGSNWRIVIRALAMIPQGTWQHATNNKEIKR